MIALHDELTGADVNLNLPAQHAAMALISKTEKNIVAKYGF
jgi:hypothetical protein